MNWAGVATNVLMGTFTTLCIWVVTGESDLAKATGLVVAMLWRPD